MRAGRLSTGVCGVRVWDGYQYYVKRISVLINRLRIIRIIELLNGRCRKK